MTSEQSGSDQAGRPARRVIAECSVSIDGYSSGPGGPALDTWLYEHAMLETIATRYEGIYRGADTALLGRNNYVGFASVWPGMTRDPASDPRTRDLGEWLEQVPKIVFSRTLEEADATWPNTRIARDLESTVRELKGQDGRDILVLNSASIIQELLRLELLDDLHLTVLPVTLGGGLRLLPEGTGTAWNLLSTNVSERGGVSLHYRRA